LAFFKILAGEHLFFAAHVNEKLKLQYPERFTVLDQEYTEKVAEIDRKLLAL